MKKTVLPLWGEYSGLVLLLIHEESCRNAQPGLMFRKILVLGHHPQRLFYEHIGSHYLVHQEKMAAAAAAMAGVHHVPSYYSDRLWQTIRPPSKQRHMETVLGKQSARAIAAAMEAARTIKGETGPNTDSSDEDVVEESEDKTWDGSFEDNPHSNKKLVELLPAAIDAAGQTDQDWTGPSSFPEPVYE